MKEIEVNNVKDDEKLNDFKRVMVIKKGSVSLRPLEEIKKNTIYYNTHGEFYNLKEFFELEIQQRNNYKVEDLLEWMSKYALTSEARVIWVSPNHQIALDYEPGIKKSELRKFSSEDGTIILESDDGNNGYLYFYYEEYRLQCEKWKSIEKESQQKQYKTLDQFGKLEKNILNIAKNNGLSLSEEEISGVLKHFEELFKSDIEKLTENRPKVSFEDLGYKTFSK